MLCHPAGFRITLPTPYPAADGKQFLLLPRTCRCCLPCAAGTRQSAGLCCGRLNLSKAAPGLAEEFEIQRSIARRLQAYLVPGSIMCFANIFLAATSSSCGNGMAAPAFFQEERYVLVRAKSNSLWTAFGKLGIVIGTDAWYPLGRAPFGKGVEIVCCCGALAKGKQMAAADGMWQQVQQNQFVLKAGWRRQSRA